MFKQAFVFYCLLVGFLLPALDSYAQLNPQFNSNLVQGCAPLVVSFLDQSTGGTIIYRAWSFGNGNNSIGNNTSPTASYINPGTYSVTLTISDGVDTATITKPNYITVFANPVPDFSFTPNSGCVPLGVQFTDLSNVPLVGVNNYTWDFGDGSPTVSTINPNHVYQAAGNFTVSLNIVDANGCVATKDSVSIIQTDNKPVANFTATTPTQSCAPPLTVSFNNTSTGNNLVYNWFFAGGGGSSTQQNPTATFTQSGQFYVRLLVVNQAGCADTAFKNNYISIVPTTASFDMPDTICMGDSVPIINLSQGSSQYNWNFGNASTSNLQNPKVAYNAVGSYTITLQTSSPPNCVANASKTIYVEQAIADFTIDTTFGCSVPFSVNYINLSSSNVVNWFWRFDDFDPVFGAMNSTGSNPQRTVFNDMVSKDTLTVTTAAGCTATKAINSLFTVAQPKASFSLNKVSGCAPLNLKASNTSTSVDSILSYNWKFDTLGISAQLNDSFLFVNPGAYAVCLKITTSLGCVDSSCVPILAGEKPIINYTQDKDTTCAGSLVTFTDKSTDSTKINFWSWEFQDGTPPETSKGPKHSFKSLGWIGMRYIVGLSGCFDTLNLDSVVLVEGPLAEATSLITSCKTPMTYNFSSTITDFTRFKWDFGDSLGYDSVNQITQYTYPNSGNFKVIFTAINDSNNCVYKTEQNVQPRNIKAKFTITDSLSCAGKGVSFDGSISEDALSFGYNWLFGNGNTFNFTPTPPLQAYNSSGVKNVRLVAEGINGCKDTLIKPIRIFKPTSNFTASTSLGCSPLLVSFNNTSVFDTTAHKILWIVNGKDSTYSQNYSQKFIVSDTLTNSLNNVVSDTFFVDLWVTDTLGCTSFKTDSLFVDRYLSNFKVSKNNLCVGETFTLSDSLNFPNLVYRWFFGNGDSLSGNPISFQFPSAGVFKPYVKRIEASGSCINVDTLNFQFEVEGGVKLKFFADKTDSTCFPFKVLFKDTTNDSTVVKRYWQFMQGGSNIQVAGSNASYTYNSPGAYNVKLIVETKNGCLDSLTKSSYINLDGPQGVISVSPDTSCINDEIKFSVNSIKNIKSIFFDFGDGNDTTLTSDSSITYGYNQVGTISPLVILSDSLQNCKVTKVLKVYIHQVKAGINFLTDSAGCRPFSGKFIDVSKGNSSVFYTLEGFPFLHNSDSTITISTSGNYNLVQFVSDTATGCSDSTSRLIKVYNKANLGGVKDTTICMGDTFNVSLAGGVKYLWIPNIYLLGDSLANNIITPLTETNYTIFGEDQFGCKDTLTAQIGVQPDYTLEITKDTTIYQGEFVELFANTSFDVKYLWSPSDALDCIDCPFPIANPIKTITYYISTLDFNNCFPKNQSVTIEVIEAFSAGLPDTFTPNGDGINDIIYVKGWGIAEILEFKIYNRWGEVVFETNDLSQGWNGKYKGQDQEIDTYVYILRVKGFADEEISTKGLINLTR